MSAKSHLIQLFQHSTLKRTFSTQVSASHNTKAIQEKVKLRIAAATIVERIPVILPDVPQFELDYLSFVKKRNEVYDKEQSVAAQKRVDEEMKIRAKKEKGGGKKKGDKADETGKKSKKDNSPEGEKVVMTEEVIYPRITNADKRNDRKSLYRALDKRLYLIVKKARSQHAWGFPQGGWELKDGYHLRNTAERELKEECGDLLNTFFIGNAPMGYISYPIPKDLQPKFDNAHKTKLFFYKARYLRGPIRLNAEELEDHLWVTKQEMKEYFDPALYNYVSKIIME